VEQEDSSRRARRYNGASGVDVPLLPEGREMADALASFYGDMPFEAIYASPAQRARQTAEPLAARRGLPVGIEPGLREIDYGGWDGLLEDEVRARYPGEFARWAEDPGRHAPPGGENGLAIAARALASVDAIRGRHASGNVLAVSHKATIRVLVCALLGLDVGLFRARIGQPVSAVTVFEFRPGGPLLRTMGDTSHVPRHLRGQLEA
jgi:probable phosphoglycerate mutase